MYWDKILSGRTHLGKVVTEAGEHCLSILLPLLQSTVLGVGLVLDPDSRGG